jgi:hypothetical protein
MSSVCCEIVTTSSRVTASISGRPVHDIVDAFALRQRPAVNVGEAFLAIARIDGVGRQRILRARQFASVGPSRKNCRDHRIRRRFNRSSVTPSTGVAHTETLPPPKPDELALAPALTAIR